METAKALKSIILLHNLWRSCHYILTGSFKFHCSLPKQFAVTSRCNVRCYRLQFIAQFTIGKILIIVGNARPWLSRTLIWLYVVLILSKCRCRVVRCTIHPFTVHFYFVSQYRSMSTLTKRKMVNRKKMEKDKNEIKIRIGRNYFISCKKEHRTCLSQPTTIRIR